MSSSTSAVSWQAVAILIGRIVFAALFAMAAFMKFTGMEGTAQYIASAGFPFPLFLAWCAAIFETLLVIALLSGAFFAEMALLGAIYVVFLGFAFHWPNAQSTQDQVGAFINHFTFMAGLLFAAVNGPGRILASRRTFIGN